MKTIDDFVTLVRDEIGLPVTAEHLDTAFDGVPDWDSLHLLRLVAVLERETGRTLSFPDVLEATDLNSLYRLAVAG
ncbi:acyl carrier protein [Streptomyces sp. NPDC059740]|uniref:acyl carrier protein n=1 Tax=Streptomyces sp. NPDC059740 TaxID=3346926 RepID=UPI0036485BED